MNKKERYAPVIVYLHETQNVIDTAAALKGMDRSLYIRTKMSEVATKDINEVLEGVDNDK